MTLTPNHSLDLIEEYAFPWGQRMRDNLTIIDESLPFVQATMWALDNNQVTDIITQNVAVKANIPNSAGISPCGCFQYSANRAIYSGTDRVLLVVAAFTVNAVGANETFRVYLALNGAVIDHASAKVRDTSAGNFGSGTLTGVTPISNGDFLEIWVANLTSTGDVTMVDLSMSMRG